MNLWKLAALTLVKRQQKQFWISEKYRLAYAMVPKAACTSVRKWFLELEKLGPPVPGRSLSLEGELELALLHDVMAHEGRRLLSNSPPEFCGKSAGEGWFSFSVVRNPYTRVFSAWQSKILYEDPPMSKMHDMGVFAPLPADRKELAESFENFLVNLERRQDFLDFDWHFVPQVSILLPNEIEYSLIGQLEALAPLKKKLADLTGPGAPALLSGHKANECLIPYQPDFFTAGAEKIVRKLYREDFLAFKYDSRLPPARRAFSDGELGVALQGVKKLRERHARILDLYLEIKRRAGELPAGG